MPRQAVMLWQLTAMIVHKWLLTFDDCWRLKCINTTGQASSWRVKQALQVTGSPMLLLQLLLHLAVCTQLCATARSKVLACTQMPACIQMPACSQLHALPALIDNLSKGRYTSKHKIHQQNHAQMISSMPDSVAPTC